MPRGIYKRKEITKQRIKESKLGNKHPNWKGGRSKHSDGYILLYKPNHPYKNYKNRVREHRLVMEKFLGRDLMPNEVVHHLDGNKENNKIDNLYLTKICEHQELAVIFWRIILKLGLAEKVLKELHKKE